MASKKGRLPKTFGQFTKLPKTRIEEIRQGAKCLVAAFKANDQDAWSAIISAANKTLTKQEVGVFAAFALNEVENG